MRDANEGHYFVTVKARMKSGDKLFDFAMPDGKPLGDYTSGECREAAEWMKERGELKMARWLTLIADEVKSKNSANVRSRKPQSSRRPMRLARSS